MDREVRGTAETHVTRTRVLTDSHREPLDRWTVVIIIVSMAVACAVAVALYIVKSQMNTQSAQIAGLRSQVTTLAGQVSRDKQALAAAKARASTLESQVSSLADTFPQTCQMALTSASGAPGNYVFPCAQKK